MLGRAGAGGGGGNAKILARDDVFAPFLGFRVDNVRALYCYYCIQSGSSCGRTSSTAAPMDGHNLSTARPRAQHVHPVGHGQARPPGADGYFPRDPTKRLSRRCGPPGAKTAIAVAVPVRPEGAMPLRAKVRPCRPRQTRPLVPARSPPPGMVTRSPRLSVPSKPQTLRTRRHGHPHVCDHDRDQSRGQEDHE